MGVGKPEFGFTRIRVQPIQVHPNTGSADPGSAESRFIRPGSPDPGSSVRVQPFGFPCPGSADAGSSDTGSTDPGSTGSAKQVS